MLSLSPPLKSSSLMLHRCEFYGLKNTLNMRPVSGMQPWEDKYSEMAKAMGIDPTVSACDLHVMITGRDHMLVT